MSRALLRNVAADTALLIRRNAAASTDRFGKTGVVLSRPYFRSPQLLGRAKETGVSPSPSLGFCSSSSASISKVGFVGWYLGMVKSRPVLTKSVTSSLIYIAADLSSQVLWNCFKFVILFPSMVAKKLCSFVKFLPFRWLKWVNFVGDVSRSLILMSSRSWRNRWFFSVKFDSLV